MAMSARQSSKSQPNNSVPSPSSSLSSPGFEFTKRKRWADLLVHEISEAVVFILSTNGTIWFCGRAVSEILGWADAELIDCAFTDIVNQEDHREFLVAFDVSVRTRTEMTAYIRLKARTPITPQNIPQSEVLFEVKGSPYFVENELTPRCFFAVARPYPSRNTAILNTLMALRAENERLEKRLAELRVHAPSPTVPVATPSTSGYPCHSSFTCRTSAPSVSLHPPETSSSLYTHQQLRSSSYDDFGSLSSHAHGAGYDSLSLYAYRGQYASTSVTQPADEELGDETSKRKKMRKSNTTEQYVCVTCGRTDSPEWRKGPQGPKTLCNACGLRWAKEVRNKADETSASGTSTTANAA